MAQIELCHAMMATTYALIAETHARIAHCKAVQAECDAQVTRLYENRALRSWHCSADGFP